MNERDKMLERRKIRQRDVVVINDEEEGRRSQSYYVVSEPLPLLLFEGLTKAVDELVQFLGVTSQELPDVLQAPQAVGGWRAELGRARIHLNRPGDAQDAVALLLVVVEGFLKQDGD